MVQYAHFPSKYNVSSIVNSVFLFYTLVVSSNCIFTTDCFTYKCDKNNNTQVNKFTRTNTKGLKFTY